MGYRVIFQYIYVVCKDRVWTSGGCITSKTLFICVRNIPDSLSWLFGNVQINIIYHAAIFKFLKTLNT